MEVVPKEVAFAAAKLDAFNRNRYSTPLRCVQELFQQKSLAANIFQFTPSLRPLSHSRCLPCSCAAHPARPALSQSHSEPCEHARAVQKVQPRLLAQAKSSAQRLVSFLGPADESGSVSSRPWGRKTRAAWQAFELCNSPETWRSERWPTASSAGRGGGSPGTASSSSRKIASVKPRVRESSGEALRRAFAQSWGARVRHSCQPQRARAVRLGGREGRTMVLRPRGRWGQHI